MEHICGLLINVHVLSFCCQGNPTVISSLENERHGLEDGDVIELKEVVGMEKLNQGENPVKGT